MGSLPFDFLQSLSLSSSLELKVFDKQSTLVLMRKSEIVVSFGVICKVSIKGFILKS